MDDKALRDAATTWIAGDPDPDTRAVLQAALDEADLVALRAALARPLSFGTAGLRGEVGPGPARMNRATVIRTTWALVTWLDEADHEGPVAVGYDARPDSARFAADVVGVLLAAGREVVGWDEPTPTPLVAWAAREAGAAAAVVVTASHNPPQDNGYKVYGPDAIQIVPPTDLEVAELVATAPPAREIARIDDPWGHDRVEELGRFAHGRYLDQVAELVPDDGVARGDVGFVHTALHGVGGALVAAALARTGVEALAQVPEQHEPDGSFPTVDFPNPEEPGALDLAFALADERGADLVLANDPDVDRFAVGVRDGGQWRRLSGNEVAVLLADDLLARAGERSVVATSIVTSPWVAAVAEHHGARHEYTLTGFKWIWHALHALEQEGWTPVLGAEEALGYSIGGVVRDKDGITATTVFCDLARRLATDGSSVLDRLAQLRARDGAWVAAQVSAVRDGPDGPDAIAAAMDRIRQVPPDLLGDVAVTDVTDLAVGQDQRPAWLPDSDLVELTLDRGRALLRPSGTEPKIKAYVDLVAPDPDEPAAARALAERTGRALLAAAGL